jgi:hypothetical protein
MLKPLFFQYYGVNIKEKTWFSMCIEFKENWVVKISKRQRYVVLEQFLNSNVRIYAAQENRLTRMQILCVDAQNTPKFSLHPTNESMTRNTFLSLYRMEPKSTLDKEAVQNEDESSTLEAVGNIYGNIASKNTAFFIPPEGILREIKIEPSPREIRRDKSVSPRVRFLITPGATPTPKYQNNSQYQVPSRRRFGGSNNHPNTSFSPTFILKFCQTPMGICGTIALFLGLIGMLTAGQSGVLFYGATVTAVCGALLVGSLFKGSAGTTPAVQSVTPTSEAGCRR